MYLNLLFQIKQSWLWLVKGNQCFHLPTLQFVCTRLGSVIHLENQNTFIVGKHKLLHHQRPEILKVNFHIIQKR